MKTKFTLSVAEAEFRLASKMQDDVPYSDNEISVEIVLPEMPSENLTLRNTSKIALIRLVRKLSDDLLAGRLYLTPAEAGAPTPYLGLGESKKFVESYLRDNEKLTNRPSK